jgi:GrpB-like predicted nucleotidyltransferase (UPF0157 family)
MSNYSFKPYNKIFPELFEKEKERLTKYLSGKYRIEHCGSTAVPGLGGKGIIDIFIVTSKKNLRKISQEIINSGYEYRPRGTKITGHPFYRLELPDIIENTRRYHIHLNDFDEDDFKQAIAFRDYLRNHLEEVKKYADIKEKAVNEGKQDVFSYMDAKRATIQEILKKALGK